MLSVLTQTALLRRWPPSLFARLCNQLRDSPEHSKSGPDVLLSLVQGDHAPLLFEYILYLSWDPSSILPLEKLLELWANEDWKQRTPRSQHLMAYITKGLNGVTGIEDHNLVANSIVLLTTQAVEGSREANFLVKSLGDSSLAPQILHHAPHIPARLQEISAEHADAFGPSRTQQDVGQLSYTPGRTFRLLWLDEFISNSVLYPGNQLFTEQLDILWPNEISSTLAFELSLTTFDAYASARSLKTRVSIWEAFILKKLPLILRHLAKGEKLDNALTRLLTSMDKEVAAAVDATEMRLNFVRACADLNLCDASVLHALHRDYHARPENLDTLLDIPVKDISRQIMQENPEKLQYSQSIIVRLVEGLPSLQPLALELACQEIRKFVRNPRVNIRSLAWFSTAFLNSIESCDNLFMHVPMKSILEYIVKKLDTVYQVDTTLSSSQVYGDIGSIFTFLNLAITRYEIHIPSSDQQSIWTYKVLFQDPTDFSNFEELSPQLQNLLGCWIKGLIGGRGVTDDCLKSPEEVFNIFPALIKQLVLAYQDNIVPLETLKMGLEYFLQPYLAPALPLILKSLLYNIWAQLNVEASVEVLQILLLEVDKNSTIPEFRAIINIITPDLEQSNNYALSNGNVNAIISSIIEKARPISFPKLEIKGSYVSAFETNIKGLIQWQNEPVGFPIVDGRLFNMGLKYFGKEEIMRMAMQNFEDVPAQCATEIQVAFVVLYCSRLVRQVNSAQLIPTGFFPPSIIDIATNYVKKFQAIYEGHVDVAEEEIPPDEEPDASIFNVPQVHDVPLAPTEPLLEADSSFNYGFDMDASGPMGMDELDDAMNLDYFQ